MSLDFLQSAEEIEDQLRQAAQSVDWLGELDISPEQFKQLRQAVYEVGGRTRPDPRHVPTLMLVTSMVFMARYAEFGDDETPSFWRPYLENVWQRHDDLSFQTECREAFRKARSKLEDDLGLYFPHKTTHEQDVVSGIYMHAILPSYLEDDFARWLTGLWERGVTWALAADMPLEERLVAMRYHHSAEQIPVRLRRFIERDETCETAARLIETLAIAAQEVANGESFDQVAEMLAPIERAIWKHLRPSLEGSSLRGSEKRQAKRGLMRMRWAWHMGRNSLGLLVQNWRVESETPPDRLVWAKTEDELRRYERYANLQPWRRDDGWWIDQASLEGIGNGGWVALVAEDDQELSKDLPVPPLMGGEVLFFELSADSKWAVQARRERLSDGPIIIVSSKPFCLDIHGAAECPPQCLPALPDLLHSLDYRHAALYDLRLPAQLVYDDDRLPLRSRITRLKAVLEGTRLAHLSDGQGGVFNRAPTMRLRGAAALRASLGQICLRLEGARHGLRQAVFNAEKLRAEDGDLLLPLDDLKLSPDLYRLTVSHSAARVTIDSLDFALLPPDWAIQAPTSASDDFTVYQPPEAVLRGPNPSTLRLPEGATLSQEGPELRVRWTRPDGPAHLLIEWGEALLPMEWPVTWRHAQIDPPRTHVTQDELQETRLLLQGQPKQAMTLHVGDMTRTIQLYANGRYEALIANDALRDMLVDQPDALVDVSASDGKARWPLFTFVRQEDEAVLALPGLVRRAFTLARALPRDRAYSRRAWYKPERLLAMPTAQLADFQAALAGPYQPIIEVMQSIPRIPLTALQPWAVPPYADLVLSLEGVAKPLHVRAESLPPWGGQGHVNDGKLSLTLSWSAHANGKAHVQISARGAWRVCAVCGDIFDESKKIYHSHQRSWSITHPSLSGEYVGAFRWADDALPHGWQADFGCALDRDKIRSYRIRKKRAPKQAQAPFYTIEGYCYAVVEWSLAMNNKSQLKQLEGFLYGSLAQQGLNLRTELTQADDARPVLRWLKPFFAALDTDGDEWKRLDLALATLALNVRGQAHSLQLPFAWSWLSDDELHQALAAASSACPHLLAWAFGWIELILWATSAAEHSLLKET
ncbi:MAG: hypothetical protein RML73_02210 [Anaerolineae bacterium]|nr:hypothetical protein [Anaerolineae bacterium]